MNIIFFAKKYTIKQKNDVYVDTTEVCGFLV